MIIIKSDSEIDLMRESGKVTGFILKELENIIRPGLSTADIDRFVEKTIREAGMIHPSKGTEDSRPVRVSQSTMKLFMGFPTRKEF